MQLSVDDMRRIVSGGEIFLLVDVRPVEITKGRAIPRAVRVPFGHELVPKVLAAAGPRAMPIVICGDGPNDPVAKEAAERLRKEGFSEIWTYSSDPEAWIQHRSPASVQPKPVTSDPDKC
jgi:hypothetical protein